MVYLCFLKGLLSTYEAVHFAKPIIGIPIFFDQNKNMKMVEHLGYGIQVPYQELTAQKLRSAIQQIFTDQRFETPTKYNIQNRNTLIHYNFECKIFEYLISF